MHKRIAVGLAFMLAACAEERPIPETRFVAGAATERIWHLPVSPNQLARHQLPALEAPVHLVVGIGDVEFHRVADVKSLGLGRFAVLDRGDAEIVVLDTTGNPVRRFGRRGEGPGEYKDPVAIASLPDGVVVWQIGSVAALTRLDSMGAVIYTMALPADGDAHLIPFRNPKVFVDGYQMGPEDVTRRLRRFDDQSFVHEIRSAESAGSGFSRAPAHLIAYSTRVPVVLDTVSVLSGPETKLDPLKPSFLAPEFIEPFYTPRAVWTSGDGWWAHSDGADTVIVVHRHGTAETTLVTWPYVPHAVTAHDRVANVEHELAAQLLQDRTFEADWNRAARRTQRRRLESYAEDKVPWFATVHREVSALYGAGQCLFVAGSDPAAYIDGTALTWFGINLLSGVVMPIRLGNRPARVRDFDERFAYVTRFNADGRTRIELHRLPDLEC
jgi:hypothetical protein